MTRTTTPRRPTPRATSLDKLHKLVQPGLIGKKCWKVIFNCGDLSLHMGARLPYDNPKMAGEKKGEWIFGNCGTRWLLLTPTQTIKSEDAGEETVERKAKAVENSQIVGFGVSVPDNVLLLDFSNNCRLLVIPQTGDAKYDLPYWELFIPGDKFISFGPGAVWSCRRSDVSAG